MRKILTGVGALLILAGLSGCGYSLRASTLGYGKTIYVEPFKNRIVYGTETARNLYLPLLENKITNAVVDRFLFDGSMKIAEKEAADFVLQGELIDFRRDVLRYDENNEVLEYRITITVSMTFFDNVAH